MLKMMLKWQKVDKDTTHFFGVGGSSMIYFMIIGSNMEFLIRKGTYIQDLRFFLELCYRFHIIHFEV